MRLVFSTLIAKNRSLNIIEVMKWQKILKENVKYLPSISELIACLLAPLLIFIYSQYAYGSDITTFTTDIYLINYFVIACMMYSLIALSNNIKFSIISTAVFFVGFSIINYYVTIYRGTPVLPWDIIAIKTALNVAGGYSFTLTFEIAVAVILTLVMSVLLVILLPKRKFISKTSIFVRTASLIVAVYLFSLFNTSWEIESYGVKTDTWAHKDAYRKYGIPSEFILNLKFLNIDVPENYSTELKDDIINNFESSYQTYDVEKTPNIIVIMNESWTDYEEFGNIELSEPVMENIKNLDNSIFGHAYSSVWGGGTSQSEFEFLTGNSMAFLPPNSVPYQQYLKGDTNSYVWYLKSLGFDTLAYHSYLASGWNREKAYDYLGFDDFISMEDMVTPLEYGHQDFCYDRVDFAELIYRYENRDMSKPFFLFNVTMQNHGGYDDFIMDDVSVIGTDHAYPKAEFYLSLVNKTDEAFMELVDYFKQVDEPVIILMYGDHQPYVEDEFIYTAMGIEDPSNKTQLIERYRVPFVFWANYDLPDITIKDSSLNFLMQDLLSLAGIETNKYGEFIYTLNQTIPSLSFNGYFDNDGQFYTHEDSDGLYDDLIDQYRILAYANLFDESYQENSISSQQG